MIKINDNILEYRMIHNIHKKKRDKGFPISLILTSVLGVAMITYSATAISAAYAQTVVPIPKHTFAYETGAKKGLAAAKAGVYNVGAACASFTGNDLEHCIAGYYDALAGYHDTVLAANTISKYHNGTNK
jgi:pyruvate carboxylase